MKKNLNTQRFLVTGGLGFIGSAVAKRLMQEEGNVLIYDKETYAADRKRLAGADIRIIKGDIADPVRLRKVIDDFAPTTILNFAAETHVDNSLKNETPFVETNVYGTAVLLDQIVKANARINHDYSPLTRAPIKLIHMSTDEVYGPSSEPAAKENTPFHPTNPYAKSKAMADLFLQNAMTDLIILRSTNIYGPMQHPEKMIPKMIQHVKIFKPLQIYGNGKEKRCWLHIDDFLDGLISILHLENPHKIYNIKGEEILSNTMLKDLLLTIADDLSIPHAGFSYVEDRINHDFFYNIDDSLLRSQIDFNPTRKLSDFFISELQK